MKLKSFSFLFVLLTYITSSLVRDYTKSRVETVKSFSFLFVLLTYITSSLVGDYPKPMVEIEIDEIGSLLQEEGIVFRPGKTKILPQNQKLVM